MWANGLSVECVSSLSSPSDKRLADEADPNTELGNRRYQTVVPEPAGAQVGNENSGVAAQEEAPAAVNKPRETGPESRPAPSAPVTGTK